MCSDKFYSFDDSMSILEMIEYLHKFTVNSRKAVLKRDLQVYLELEDLREEVKQLSDSIKRPL